MKRSRYRCRPRNVEHMLAVKLLPCCARELSRCEGVVEADHAGRRGMGQKCPDEQVIPLCTKHHRERTDFSGAFRAWDQARMRAWLEGELARVKTDGFRFVGEVF